MPGDYDGDGLCDIAVYGRETGDWYILFDDGGTRTVRLGAADTIPVPADYDGDGKYDLGVYHPATGNWDIERSSDGNLYRIENAGRYVTIPVPGDLDGDGLADQCVFHFRPRRWYHLRSTDGEIDGPTQWGSVHAQPVLPVHIEQSWYGERR